MLDMEAKELLEVAAKFWPKSEGCELGLLKKIISNQDYTLTKEALEQVRTETRFQTLPLDKINEKIKTLSQKKQFSKEQQFHCWALNRNTGKSLEVVIVEQYEDRVSDALIRYIEKWYNDSTDFDLFIGRDKHAEFLQARMDIRKSFS